MDRATVYATLAAELEHWRQQPFGELADLVEALPSVRTTILDGQVITVEVRIRQANSRPGTLRVEAVADGLSCWMLERLEESILVTAIQSTTAAEV